VSARLAKVIRRILAGPEETGLGRVMALAGPGEVRLEGRRERALVAGTCSPAVGEMIPWARVDEGLLVVSKHIPLRPQALFAFAVGKRWEQVRVNYSSANLGVMLAHRDSSGRHWVKVRRFTPAYYSQESDEFLTPDWTYQGTGLGTNSEIGDRASQIGDGDSFVEVGEAAFIPLGVRRITIDPGSGGLNYGSMISLPDKPDGQPIASSVCKDADGYYHVAATIPWPYVTEPPQWQEVCWRSDSPDSISSWTRNLYVMHQMPPGNWKLPLLLPVGDQVVCLRWSRTQIDEEVYDDVRCRLYAGGWGGEADPGFDGDVIDGVGGPDLHITYRAAEGGHVWRRAALSGAALEWDSPVALLASATGALGALHRNWAEGSTPAAAWVSNSAKEFWRYGLPPGDDEEDIESPDPLSYAITNGGLQAGGESEAAGRDGFAAFIQYRTVYAARIVEAEA